MNVAKEVKKALPEPEYEKRKQFEILQKVHDERAKRHTAEVHAEAKPKTPVREQKEIKRGVSEPKQ